MPVDLNGLTCTVSQRLADGIRISGGVTKAVFVKLREKPDSTLDLPDRMQHALQVNLRGGQLPEPEADGHACFEIPVNQF